MNFTAIYLKLKGVYSKQLTIRGPYGFPLSCILFSSKTTWKRELLNSRALNRQSAPTKSQSNISRLKRTWLILFKLNRVESKLNGPYVEVLQWT